MPFLSLAHQKSPEPAPHTLTIKSDHKVCVDHNVGADSYYVGKAAKSVRLLIAFAGFSWEITGAGGGCKVAGGCCGLAAVWCGVAGGVCGVRRGFAGLQNHFAGARGGSAGVRDRPAAS